MGVTITTHDYVSTNSISRAKSNVNSVSIVNDTIMVKSTNPHKVMINDNYCVPCDQLKNLIHDDPELSKIIEKYCK